MPVLTKINTNVIADNAVTAAKIPAGAVGASEIPAGAVGSSEIADAAVLPANISHLGDGTGNLSGTLTGEQLRFGTAFTLTDDLTVNGDVTLGKVGDDSTGQSLTQDSSANRTITGTGTLRMGSSMSSVEGMTGALGSDVTGGTGLTALGTVTTGNLSNTNIVYPAGHVIQTKADTLAGEGSGGAGYRIAIGTSSAHVLTSSLEVPITFKSTSNKCFVSVFIPNWYNNSVAGTAIGVGFRYSTDNYSSSDVVLGERNTIDSYNGYLGTGSDAFEMHLNVSTWAAVPTTSPVIIRVITTSTTGTSHLFWNSGGTGGTNTQVATLTVQEIQQ